MVTQTETAPIEFSGTKKEKELAKRIYDAMRIHGRFMSVGAPIRVTFSSLIEFLGNGGVVVTEESVRKAAVANPHIFGFIANDDNPLLVTGHGGHVPSDPTGLSHSFAQRFLTPLPKPERPAMPARERIRMAPSWSSLPAILPGMDDEDDLDSEELVAEVVVPAANDIVADALDDEVVTDEPGDDRELAARIITLPSAPGTDVTGVDDIELATAIGDRLRDDARVASFGDMWMIEDRVPRFSRGDLRRLKEYLQEQEQPLTDETLVQDVLSVRPGSSDFELMKFAANFRLTREHRDFDFVGTSNQRFWSTSNLPQIGTARRKPNEIGIDYRFLVDEVGEGTAAARSIPHVDHTLTFYEYQLGLLPFNQALQALLPGPLMPNQRSAVLTFECPQVYTTYLVELRYATPNRGGFILGLDDFYSENLVPGAILSINRTENDGHYRVEYLTDSNEQARILELDERRAQRYVFRPTSYSCAVDPAMLLTENRFPRLSSEKPLDDKARRRPETVVAVTFDRIAEEREGGYWASFADLFAAVNVERPFSDSLLRSVLEHDDTGAFSRDPDGADAYTYVPGTTPGI